MERKKKRIARRMLPFGVKHICFTLNYKKLRGYPQIVGWLVTELIVTHLLKVLGFPQYPISSHPRQPWRFPPQLI
ncbi:protein of unknown function [Xenorhabdus poinarii G6]|uniref:Uncharacterized protein n=1 Tax=Xenorhabdus poinarii G6 TaxID=1354304 RepID=A0A068R390_9GAMM|nr:protein of unknown function [Xenorhabdus poinarii G6]